jgi:hypothetical protein
MNHTQPLSFGESMVLGDEGVQVAELQRRLTHLGYYLGAVDERYGETTEAAVREFQRAAGLAEDGRMEFETWESLDSQARSAGYGQSDQLADDQQAEDQDADAIQPGQLSEDGQWQWDGAEWRAADEQAQSQEHTIEPGQLSEDGQWRWDGTEWKAAAEPAAEPAAAATGETSATDVSEYPELKPGESGEWVAYLDTMLKSKGF